MRNYNINIDRIVNQLTPHYFGGRKLILFLQSLLYPLKVLADRWGKWSADTYTEMGMTSQVILLEHFLTRRFAGYFIDPADRITISEGGVPGVVFYRQDIQSPVQHPAVYKEDEGARTIALRWQNENPIAYQASFMVNVPAITGEVAQEEVEAMVAFYVNRYKLAGKKFIIRFNLAEDGWTIPVRLY